MRVDEALEVRAGQRCENAIFHRARLCGPRRVVEEGKLTEDHPRVELGDPPRVRLALPADEHAPGDDYVQRLPVLARVEHNFTFQVSPLVKQAVDDPQFAP